MKPVIQEETTGCGIAASAALAQVSYEEVKRVASGLGIDVRDKALWSDTSYIRRILSALQINTAPTETPFTSWETMPDRALLAIKWHLEEDKPFWHWVVFVREKGQAFVLDSKKSLKNHVRQDFWRMKPKWYIEAGS